MLWEFDVQRGRERESGREESGGEAYGGSGPITLVIHNSFVFWGWDISTGIRHVLSWCKRSKRVERVGEEASVG